MDQPHDISFMLFKGGLTVLDWYKIAVWLGMITISICITGFALYGVRVALGWILTLV